MSQVFSPFKNNPTEPNSQISTENAHETLFSRHANSAWGIAFVTTEAVTTATDAVADGFIELFRTTMAMPAQDLALAILKYTRAAAERALETRPGGQHAREPISLLGETKDRQATLALTALSEPSRSVLWLIDAEQLDIYQTSDVLNIDAADVSTIIPQARSDFRHFYVDATKRGALNPHCINTLNKLAAYSDKTLDAGTQNLVETHIVSCDSCRNVLSKLTDLESRLRAAIPSIPAWTRQYVIDSWNAIAESEPTMASDKPKRFLESRLARNIASAIAVAAIMTVTAVGLTFSSKDTSRPRETSSSQLATPPGAGSHNSDASANDDSAVATPTFQTSTATAASNNVAVATDGNVNPASSQTPSTTVTIVSPTTTTVIQPNVLVDLPSVAGPTTTTPTTTPTSTPPTTEVEQSTSTTDSDHHRS